MKTPEKNDWLDEVLADAIGSKESKPDFEKWQKDHPQAVEALTDQVEDYSAIEKRLRKRRRTSRSSSRK